MTKILANFVYTGHDADVQMVGLADDQFETKEYVLFQRTSKPTADEIALGHDQVHMTVGGENRSAYGGIRSIVLFDDRLLIQVEASTSELLETDTDIEVRLGSSLESLTQFAEALRTMVGSRFQDRRGI